MNKTEEEGGDERKEEGVDSSFILHPSSFRTASWSDRLVGTLRRYDEALLRKIAGRLLRPRNLWPVDELINRCLEVLDNPVALDRRLAELAPASRHLLALIGHSRQPEWVLGNLVELAMALGSEDGLAPVLDLLES